LSVELYNKVKEIYESVMPFLGKSLTEKDGIIVTLDPDKIREIIDLLVEQQKRIKFLEGIERNALNVSGACRERYGKHYEVSIQAIEQLRASLNKEHNEK